MKKILVALALAVVASAASAQTVSGSLHDLRAAPYSGDQSVCRYCHTAHWSNAAMTAAPLWARVTTDPASYTRYTGTLTTPPTTVGQNSLTCLSCHDGQTAFNVVYDPTIAAGVTLGTMTATTFQAGDERRNLGLNISTSHPVSIVYSGGTGVTLADAKTNLGSANSFFGAGVNEMECATCHEAHNNTNGFFLRTTQAAICTACHVK